MIQVELLTLMSQAVMMGNHLRHLRVADAEQMHAVADKVGLSRRHAELLIVATERAAKHRSEGHSELRAIELLSTDRELMAQLLEHTRRAVEGVR